MEYRVEVTEEMEFCKKHFRKQDKNSKKNKKVKEILNSMETDEL